MSGHLVECDGIWTPNDREDKIGMYLVYTPKVLLAPFLVQEVEAEYSVANGHSHNAEVIYGDTDSVMVRFGPTDLDKVMAIGMQYLVLMVLLTHDWFR